MSAALDYTKLAPKEMRDTKLEHPWAGVYYCGLSGYRLEDNPYEERASRGAWARGFAAGRKERAADLGASS